VLGGWADIAHAYQSTLLVRWGKSSIRRLLPLLVARDGVGRGRVRVGRTKASVVEMRYVENHRSTKLSMNRSGSLPKIEGNEGGRSEGNGKEDTPKVHRPERSDSFSSSGAAYTQAKVSGPPERESVGLLSREAVDVRTLHKQAV
jgi:hypothetical protein